MNVERNEWVYFPITHGAPVYGIHKTQDFRAELIIEVSETTGQGIDVVTIPKNSDRDLKALAMSFSASFTQLIYRFMAFRMKMSLFLYKIRA